MNKEEEYLSDSDQSDEDFCPDKANVSDAPSEEESDDPISENEDESVKKKKSKSRTKASNKPKKSTKEPVVEEHVVATRNRTETSTKSSIEKDELESDEEDPSRKDALWADFLSDVGPPAPSKPNRAESSSKSENKPALNKKPSPAADKKPEPAKEPEKVVVTEIFEFAGEEVRVEKSVDADSLKENGSKMVPASSGSDTARGPSKRPAGGGGGLGSILSNIGKKKKISVLEKTKIDWDTFKSTEGISEELQTFNKGKDGYLQRQDFLERTDLRQFEIEKSIRQARRKPM